MADTENNPLQHLIRSLPDKPGIYQYLDKDQKVIYVGKAKNLKKRVASYFTKTHQSGKLKMLVRKIDDINFIVTNTELDALLLENNLIKKYQPRYNIQLKDDKSFPWLCIKKEHFPRIFPTRNIIRDGSEYFGPYASVRMMKTLLETIKQLYPLRTCSLNLHPKNIEKGKYKVCLEYHIGNCKAPCVSKQSEEDYDQTIQQIRAIIKGNITTVIQELQKLMFTAAQKEDFEQAQTIKEKLEILERYKSKSTIVNPNIKNVDVMAMVNDEQQAFVNYLKVINGAIVQAHTVELKKKLEERNITNIIPLLAHPGLALTNLQVTTAANGGMDGKSDLMNQAQSAEDGATGIIRASMDKEARPGDFYGPIEGWKGFPELLNPEDLLLDEANIRINWEGCEKAVGEFNF